MRITLTHPHEHAGRQYPAGSTMDLPADAAEWLIAIGTAVVAVPAQTHEDDAGKPAGLHR